MNPDARDTLLLAVSILGVLQAMTTLVTAIVVLTAAVVFGRKV